MQCTINKYTYSCVKAHIVKQRDSNWDIVLNKSPDFDLDEIWTDSYISYLKIMIDKKILILINSYKKNQLTN